MDIPTTKTNSAENEVEPVENVSEEPLVISTSSPEFESKTIWAKLPESVIPKTEDPHSYYSIPGLGLEANDIIEALELDFSKGSAMKYLVRAGRKPGQSEIKDLTKAVDFLQKRIAYLQRKCRP